jgi:polar amino acid transport system substrate-binding protein
MLATLLNLVALAASTSAEETLRVDLTADEYAPMITETLPGGGLMTQIVRESFKIGGVEAAVRFLPNNRAITGVMKGVYAGSFGWTHSAERDQKLLFSHTPISSFHIVFFQRAGETYAWKSLADLKGYRIGTTLGNFYSDEFAALQNSPDAEVEEAGSDIANIKKLLAGRIDLFPMDEESGRFLLSRNFSPEEQSKIIAQTQAIAEAPVYVVMRRDLPRAAELLDRFDRGYQHLVESGELAKLVRESRQATR